jgi:hypothetical protein
MDCKNAFDTFGVTLTDLEMTLKYAKKNPKQKLEVPLVTGEEPHFAVHLAPYMEQDREGCIFHVIFLNLRYPPFYSIR